MDKTKNERVGGIRSDCKFNFFDDYFLKIKSLTSNITISNAQTPNGGMNLSTGPIVAILVTSVFYVASID